MKSREQKRIEAEARQAVYDALHPLAKMNAIEARPGESGRERVRVERALGIQPSGKKPAGKPSKKKVARA